MLKRLVILLPNGTYWIINAHTGKALTVYNSGTTAGTNVVQSDNVNGTNQRWQVITNTNTSYPNRQFTLILAEGTYGKCLAAASSTMSNGVNIQLSNDCTAATSNWDIYKPSTKGNYMIQSKCGANFVVAVENSSNTNVYINTYNGTDYCNDEWIFVPVSGDALETVTIAIQMDSAIREEYPNFADLTAIFSDAAKPFYNRFHIQLIPTFYNISTMEADECTLDYDIRCSATLCGSNSICQNKNVEPNHHKNFDFNALRAWNTYSMYGKNIRMNFTGFQMCHINGKGIHSTGALGWWPVEDDNRGTTGLDGMVEINNYNRTYTENVRVIQHELSHAFGCGHCDDEDCIMYSGTTSLEESSIYNRDDIWCDECVSQINRTKF